MIFTAVATTGAYEMFTFDTGYFMLDLDFAILPCAPLERLGYVFTLSASFSRAKTPAGVVVPFVRDAQTGFHFLIDHLLAAPGLGAKHNIAEHFKRSGQAGEVNDFPPLTDAESLPAGTDSADTLTAALQSDLGGAVTSLTWAADKPAGVQVRPQTRSQVPKSNGKGVGDLKNDKDAVAAQKSAQTVDSREDTRARVWLQDEPVDLDREIQEEIESTDPDRWRYQTERTKALKRPEPTLCDSSPDSGEEEEANAEERTSDDAYFKEAMTEMGKKRNKAIKIKPPAVKLTDPRVPKEVKKMKQHLHRLFGHFHWAAIKQASKHIEGAELVKLLNLAGSLPDEHCSGCVEGK